jgi:hypothetical protein
MADDRPFYSAFKNPDPPYVAQPGEPMWTLVNGDRRVWVSNSSLSRRDRQLDKVPAVRDPTHVV